MSTLRFALMPIALVIISFLSSQGEALAAGGSMTSGGNYSGSLVRGQQDQWTFHANAGDAIRITMSEVGTNTNFIPQFEVHAPDGTSDGYNYGDLFAPLGFTAPQTGTYTVLAYRRDANDGVGQYMLTLAQAPESFIVPAGDEGGAMTDGGNYSGSLLRGDMDQWSFHANAGDAIRVTMSQVGTNTNFIPQFEVHAPDGSSDGYNYGDLFAPLGFTAPQTGTYTVWAYRRDANDGVGQYMLTLAQAPESYIVPVGDEGGLMVSGGTYSGNVLRGDMDQWTFDASQGNPIRVTISEAGPNTNFIPQFEVHAPDGTSEGYNYGDLTAALSFSAPQTGSYTVLAYRRDANDGVGTYSLSLSGATPAPDPVLVHNLPAPRRIVDTRTTSGPIASGTSRCFDVAGVDGIPDDAAAVDLNITAVGYGTDGWLTVYPNGQAVPATSTLNFDTHEYALANATIMRLGAGGQVCVSVGTVNSAPGSAQVLLDATGDLTASGLLHLPMLSSPQRVVDTRKSGGPIAAGTSRCFQVAGLAGIPGDAAAVVLNVTAVGYGTRGWLSVYPNGQAVPTTSTLDFDTSEYAIANGAIVRIGTGGQLCVTAGTVNSVAGGSNAILDVTGYLTSGGLTLMPIFPTPHRLIDTRTNGGPIATGQSRCFTLAGVGGIPTTAKAVVLNVTAMGYSSRGWLTVYPGGQAVPGTSTLNFDPTEYAMSNTAVMPLGSGGQVCVEVGTVSSAPGSSQAIIDVIGYL